MNRTFEDGNQRKANQEKLEDRAAWQPEIVVAKANMVSWWLLCLEALACDSGEQFSARHCGTSNDSACLLSVLG